MNALSVGIFKSPSSLIFEHYISRAIPGSTNEILKKKVFGCSCAGKICVEWVKLKGT